MIKPGTDSSTASAGIWGRAADSSALWAALTPVRRVWAAIEHVIAGATTPPDSRETDRRVERIVGSSWLATLGVRTALVIERARRHSTVAAWCRQRLVPFTALSAVQRVRLVSQVILVASITALGAQAVSRQPVGLTGLIPAFAAAAALIVWLVAGPVTAAWEDRRRA
jgi:hypothetical protein